MGGAASIGVDNGNLTDAEKAKLFTALQAKYEAATKQPNFNAQDVMATLQKEYTEQAKSIATTAAANGSSGGGGGGSSGIDNSDGIVQSEGGLSDEDAAAQAAAFAIKLGVTDITGTSDFRKRRLSVGTTSSKPKAPPGVTGEKGGRRMSAVLYRSQEIGTDPVTPLPFPNTVVGTYSCHGVEPSYYDDDGVTAKINQDRGCVVFPIPEDQPHQALFAVYDGHGEHGDVVSHYVMHEVQNLIENNPKLKSHPGLVLKETYLAVDKSLGKLHPMEATFSGTTAVSVFMRDHHLWIANAGDSRAVIAIKQADGTLKHKNLTTDHNPDSPKEKIRIESAGGFVSPPPEEGLSSRVWLDAAMTQVGLAMARSIGDHAVKGVGVIAEPEITEHEITKDDSFMLLATDGVWEFISSEEAVKLVAGRLATGGNAMEATQVLIEAAASRWREVEGDYRDDITAVLVMLPCFST